MGREGQVARPGVLRAAGESGALFVSNEPLEGDPQSMKWKQNTLDVSRQNVGLQLAAMTAAAAQMVGLTGGNKFY